MEHRLQTVVSLKPSTFPTYPFFTFTYKWSNALPDGINFKDNTGTIIPSYVRSYTPTSAPYTISIAGTPTLTAAYQYANSNYSSNIHVTALLSRNNSNVSNGFDVTLPFSETVLFNNIYVPTIYSGVNVPPTKIFDVATYFSNTSVDTFLFTNPPLNNGTLHIIQQRNINHLNECFITGIPASNANASYTFTAVNNDGVFSQPLTVPIPVISDVVTFDYSVTPSNGTSYNFVNSRPLNQALDGYYPCLLYTSPSPRD